MESRGWATDDRGLPLALGRAVEGLSAAPSAVGEKSMMSELIASSLGRKMFKRIKRRGAESAASVQDQLDWHAGDKDVHLLVVDSAYQHASTGTKARTTTVLKGQRWDTWFRGMRVAKGQVILCRANEWWGDHNNNPTLYVNEVLAFIPARDYRRWKRATKQASGRTTALPIFVKP